MYLFVEMVVGLEIKKFGFFILNGFLDG